MSKFLNLSAALLALATGAAAQDTAPFQDGGYGLGARARQIRDDLRALESPGEKDMLAVQLDDRALFLAEWRQLVLSKMQMQPPEVGSLRADFQRVVRDQCRHNLTLFCDRQCYWWGWF